MENIRYFEELKTFKLDTKNSTYMIGLVGDENFVCHKYYGKKLTDAATADLIRIGELPGELTPEYRERCSFMDCAPFEYPAHGLGDYRDTAISVRTKGGHMGSCFMYRSHVIYGGKPKLEGLPATFGDENECTTLEITCEDSTLKLQVVLVYTAFREKDAITRSLRVINRSDETIALTRVLSASVDMENDNYDTMFLWGSWARERVIDRQPLGYGRKSMSSIRGESGHQAHPFMALLQHDANEDRGEVYGFSFVYSGNFLAQAELNQFDTVRVMMGINPDDFTWNLKAGETFTAPEVVMVYSCEGIGGMSRTFHDLYRDNLIRSPYKNKKRPILINNWEATYFDFNTEKLLSIAREAAKSGIEMLVMDDGWFGARCDDNRALGDWFVNEEKLPGGLKYLVDEVNKLGLKFGIWIEPEMISPDSDLFRAHPDWAIQIPGRIPSRSRNQLVLDYSRKEVRDYIYDMISKVLHSANIEYVKWDMNRQLSDLGSFALAPEAQGELVHRYVLGMYELEERLINEFPDLLLENCSGGGARFDPGMLYYSPQIWTSDDTDAVERLKIQQGTALIYPLSSMGAHVSDCPNHSVGRVTPFATRGYVALSGTFGYELDITRIPEADRNMIPEQVAMYHKYNDLVRCGDYYRIASYLENKEFDVTSVVAKDKSEVLVTFVQVMGRANVKSRRVKLKGLNPEKLYRNEETGEVLRGDSLMFAGINVGGLWGDFQGKLIHFTECR